MHFTSLDDRLFSIAQIVKDYKSTEEMLPGTLTLFVSYESNHAVVFLRGGLLCLEIRPLIGPLSLPSLRGGGNSLLARTTRRMRPTFQSSLPLP